MSLLLLFPSFAPAATAPDPPTAVVAVAGDGRATVTFTPPLDDGGSAIVGYTVTSTPEGITAAGESSPIIVTGLLNAQAYIFTVVATNAIGDSVPSVASNSVTPRATNLWHSPPSADPADDSLWEP